MGIEKIPAPKNHVRKGGGGIGYRLVNPWSTLGFKEMGINPILNDWPSLVLPK